MQVMRMINIPARRSEATAPIEEKIVLVSVSMTFCAAKTGGVGVSVGCTGEGVAGGGAAVDWGRRIAADSDRAPCWVDGVAGAAEVKEGRGDVGFGKPLTGPSEISAVSEMNPVGVGFGSSLVMGGGEGGVARQRGAVGASTGFGKSPAHNAKSNQYNHY